MCVTMNEDQKRFMDKVEELRQLSEEDLVLFYDVAHDKDDTFLIEVSEYAMSTYHYCDVCGNHFALDEPCEFH